jgi:hypothetical protein
MENLLNKINYHPIIVFIVLLNDLIGILVKLYDQLFNKIKMNIDLFDLLIKIVICIFLYALLVGFKKQKAEIETTNKSIKEDLLIIRMMSSIRATKTLLNTNKSIQFPDEKQKKEHEKNVLLNFYFEEYEELKEWLKNHFKEKTGLEIEEILERFYSKTLIDEFNTNSQPIS